MDVTAAVTLSGTRAAQARHRHSAHNLANLATDGFHSLHTLQTEADGLGVHVSAVRRSAPGVDVAGEIASSMSARHAHTAAARAYRTWSEMQGTVVDLMG